MPALTLILEDTDEARIRRFAEHGIHAGNTFESKAPLFVSALPDGMASGKPSVAIYTQLPAGHWVVCQSSLALLLATADALRAKYVDPRFDPRG